MKLFSYLYLGLLILGYQNVTLSFAADSTVDDALLFPQQGIHAESKQSSQTTTKFQNVEGMLKEIQGNVYVVERATPEEPIRVEVVKDTAFPNGEKEPGQLLQALISTSDGHALIIR